jgi:Flp pilus assembly pilin Flp
LRFDPRAESGQTMAEYTSVLAALIIAVVAALAILSGGIHDSLQSSLDSILAAF